DVVQEAVRADVAGVGDVDRRTVGVHGQGAVGGPAHNVGRQRGVGPVGGRTGSAEQARGGPAQRVVVQGNPRGATVRDRNVRIVGRVKSKAHDGVVAIEQAVRRPVGETVRSDVRGRVVVEGPARKEL